MTKYGYRSLTQVALFRSQGLRSPATSEDGLIPDKGFRVAIDQAKKELNITRNVPLDELRDESILREALAELRLKKN